MGVPNAHDGHRKCRDRDVRLRARRPQYKQHTAVRQRPGGQVPSHPWQRAAQDGVGPNVLTEATPAHGRAAGGLGLVASFRPGVPPLCSGSRARARRRKRCFRPSNEPISLFESGTLNCQKRVADETGWGRREERQSCYTLASIAMDAAKLITGVPLDYPDPLLTPLAAVPQPAKPIMDDEKDKPLADQMTDVVADAAGELAKTAVKAVAKRAKKAVVSRTPTPVKKAAKAIAKAAKTPKKIAKKAKKKGKKAAAKQSPVRKTAKKKAKKSKR